MITKRKLLGGILVAFGALALFATPALASSDSAKFMTVYNSVNNTYTSIKNVSGAHDKWVGSHKGDCPATQAHKWWELKYRKDVNTVLAAEKKLATVKKKHGRTYKDFVKAFDDLTHWMNGRIKPRLLSCLQTPKNSARFDNDLMTLQTDLNLIPY